MLTPWRFPRSSTIPNSQTGCGLFRLPPELRTFIFVLALTIPVDEGKPVKLVQKHRAPTQQPSVLSLLQTCRLVNDEAYGIFYAVNHLRFLFLDLDPTRACIGHRRPPSNKRMAAIEKLTIVADETQPLAYLESVCRYLRICTNLKELHLNIFVVFQLVYSRIEFDKFYERFQGRRKSLSDAAKTLPTGLQALKVRMLPIKVPDDIPGTLNKAERKKYLKLDQDVSDVLMRGKALTSGEYLAGGSPR